jgi:hypothetical protein
MSLDLDNLKGDKTHWSLDSDQKLLEALQTFSKSVNDTVTKTTQTVDSLGFEVADTSVSLRNVFNEFLMLGNSQFIENVGGFCLLYLAY